MLHASRRLIVETPGNASQPPATTADFRNTYVFSRTQRSAPGSIMTLTPLSDPLFDPCEYDNATTCHEHGANDDRKGQVAPFKHCCFDIHPEDAGYGAKRAQNGCDDRQDLDKGVGLDAVARRLFTQDALIEQIDVGGDLRNTLKKIP